MSAVKNFFLFFLLCFVCAPALAQEALPPSELIDWLDYALKRYPPQDCPHLEEDHPVCAAVTDIQLAGDLKSGRITAEFTGYNWSRTGQTLELIGPSSSFALDDSNLILSEQADPRSDDAIFIAPFFDASGGFWKVAVPPGKFQLKSSVSFKPQASFPVHLAEGVGRVRTSRLSGGYLEFDPQQGSHGGVVQLVLEGEKQEAEQKPQIRVTRVFTWSGVPTFAYQFSVSGLKREAAVLLPLLGDEVIEKLAPEKPYALREKNGVAYLEAAFAPGYTQLRIEGHYQKVPEKFVLNLDTPFEVWIHVSDRRHPVNIETDANPIDPGEFAALVNVQNARAYLAKPGQTIEFHPVSLSVDEGHKGKGSIQYEFYQGGGDKWLARLFLSAKILGRDRLVVPTPEPPTYAGIGGRAIELYHDADNRLSVRLPAEGLTPANPVEVNWNMQKDVSSLLDLLRIKLPPQNVYLEEQNSVVHFLPGIVPLFAWGAAVTGGDLLDQFHLYGFLVGILVFFISRGLKFHPVLSALVTLLFIGLYLEEEFPTTAVVVLLILTLPVVRLGDGFFQHLQSRPVRRKLIMFVWLVAFLFVVVPLAGYSRERVFEALYPYAAVDRVADVSAGAGYGLMGYQTGMMEIKARPKMEKSAEEPLPVMAQQEQPASQPSIQNRRIGKKDDYKVQEWTAKPVSLHVHGGGGRSVTFSDHHIQLRQEKTVSALLVGPVVRALWFLTETGIILWMMAALLARTKRLFVHRKPSLQ